MISLYGLTNSENLLPYKVDCLSCISECYSDELCNMKLWGWAQDNVSDSGMKARIIGVQTKMQTFSFFYGLQLAIVVLPDNLSSSLQRAELCAVDAQKNAKLSVIVPQGIRSDKDPNLHWTKVTQAAVKLELQATSLPCCLRWHLGILRLMLNLNTIPM